MKKSVSFALMRWLAFAGSSTLAVAACSGGGSSLPSSNNSAAISSGLSSATVTNADPASQMIASPNAVMPTLSAASRRMNAAGLSLIATGGTIAFSDDFTSDVVGSQASRWSVATGKWAVCQSITTGHQYCSKSLGTGVSLAGAQTWTSYHVDATVTRSAVATGGLSLLGRAQDAQHFYQLELRDDFAKLGHPMWYLMKYDGSKWTELNGGSFALHSDSQYRLRLAFAQDQISAYVAYDGSNVFVPLGAGSDGAFTSGKIGLRSWGTSTSMFGDVVVTLDGAPQPSPSPSAPPAGGVATYKGCPVFTAGDWYNADVTHAAVDPHSSDYIASVMATDGTGFYASTGIERANLVQASTPVYQVHPKVSWHSFPVPYPVPSNPFIEPASDGHYIALLTTPPSCHLYESYSTSFNGSSLSAYSGANWDLSKAFPKDQHGSAMASGLSMFAGMVKLEELAGGIHHALNFSMFEFSQCNCYTAPASGTDGEPYKGPATAYEFPYGGHLRLKASFDDSNFGPQSKAIAEAMKHYGMFLADSSSRGSNNNAIYTMNPIEGGNWNGGDLGALGNIRFSDFDVLTVGPKTNL